MAFIVKIERSGMLRNTVSYLYQYPGHVYVSRTFQYNRNSFHLYNSMCSNHRRSEAYASGSLQSLAYKSVSCELERFV